MRNVWPSEIDALVIRQEIREAVVSAEAYDPDFPPSDLAGFIAWAEGLLDDIPEEYRATATVEIGSVGSYYDSHYANIEVTYRRPETDEEWEARKKSVMDRANAAEEEERRILAQLKAKYGDPSDAQ